MAKESKLFFVNIVENNYQINIEAHGIKAPSAIEAVNDVLYGLAHDIKNNVETWIKRQIPDTVLLREYNVSRHITNERVDIAVLATFELGTPCYAYTDPNVYPTSHNYITAFVENR